MTIQNFNNIRFSTLIILFSALKKLVNITIFFVECKEKNFFIVILQLQVADRDVVHFN